MFGDKLLSALNGVEGVDLEDLQQARDLGNRMDQQANMAAGWTDNLGNVSTLALPSFPETIFSHTVSENTTAVISVKFPGSKYNTAMIVGSVGWDQPTTGVVGTLADFLALRFNEDATTGNYMYIGTGGYGSTAVELNSTGQWTSTLAQVPLTDWDHSSNLTANVFNPFLVVLPGVNTTVTKCGLLWYGQHTGALARKAVNTFGIYYFSTATINTFDFRLFRTTDATVSDPPSGHLLPGSFFSAYGFR